VIDNPEPMPRDVERAIDEHFTDAQRAAEAHLERVVHYHNELAEMGYSDVAIQQAPPDPAFGPWCGCLTCEVRETLHAALPHLEKAVLLEWGLSPRGVPVDRD
jgi:hypothetical protein